MGGAEIVNPTSDSSYSWARAFRDIGIQAINTGQFPYFCFFIIVMLFLFRLPPDTLSTLSLEVLHNFKEYALSGYALFIVTLACCGFYINALKKRHNKQIDKQDKIINQLKDELRGSIISEREAA